MVLGEVGDATPVVMRCPPGHHLNVAGEEFNQSRLSRSVRSDYSNTTVEADIDIDTSQNDFAGSVTKGGLIELEQGRCDLLGVWESERLVIVFLGRL